MTRIPRVDRLAGGIMSSVPSTLTKADIALAFSAAVKDAAVAHIQGDYSALDRYACVAALHGFLLGQEYSRVADRLVIAAMYLRTLSAKYTQEYWEPYDDEVVSALVRCGMAADEAIAEFG
jgi:hypothetical protein